MACPECAHEWSAQVDDDSAPGEKVIRDAVGNVLADGDDVTIGDYFFGNGVFGNGVF